jgi:hypothetical protein
VSDIRGSLLAIGCQDGSTDIVTIHILSIAIYIAIDKDSSDTALPDLANATIAPACAICFGSQVGDRFDLHVSYAPCLPLPLSASSARCHRLVDQFAAMAKKETLSSKASEAKITKSRAHDGNAVPNRRQTTRRFAWLDSVENKTRGDGHV